MRIFSILVVLSFSLWIAGCSSTGQSLFAQENDLIVQSQQLASHLIKNMEETAITVTRMPVGKDEPILVTTFVDVTALEPDSDFGRIIADQVASGFVQRGYHLVEAKLRKDGLLIHENMGELLLSRKLQEVSQSFAAAFVIIGTYSVGKKHIFLNAKVISVQNSRIMAANSIKIKINDTIQDLLLKNQNPKTTHFQPDDTIKPLVDKDGNPIETPQPLPRVMSDKQLPIKRLTNESIY